MTPRRKLMLCLTGNVCVLAIVGCAVYACGTSGLYWRFGPHPDLVIIAVQIDTWQKYGTLLALIAVVESSRVVVEEFGMPILGFSIYNPDKKTVTEFSKNELQFFANAMFFISAIRGVLLVMVQISQLDIALWGVLVSQCASVITIRQLLSEKQFVTVRPERSHVRRNTDHSTIKKNEQEKYYNFYRGVFGDAVVDSPRA
jgi:hypothetical protein